MLRLSSNYKSLQIFIMEQFWRDFILKNGGEYSAREKFDQLCLEILEYHYPGKQIINANKIDKIQSFHDLLLVYLPKLFTDSLNVSRKSQIRKAFNKTIQAVEEHNLKIFKWIVCTSHILTPSELKWWNQWKYRNQEQYKIDIELLDGQQIYQLLEKYSLLDKWTTEKQQKAQNQDSPQDREILDLEFSTEPSATGQTFEQQEQTSETQQNIEQPAGNKEITQEQTQIEKTQEEQPKQKIQNAASDETQTKSQIATTAQHSQQPEQKQPVTQQQNNEQILEHKQPPEQNAHGQEPQIELEKIASKYIEKKKQFKKVQAYIKTLNSEAHEKFKKLRELSQIKLEKFQEEPDIKQAFNEKIIDIFFKARNAEIEKDYDKALFYYEILMARKDDVEQKLKTKRLEIEHSLKFIEKQIELEKNILLGDAFLSQDKKLEALEHYEEALKLDENNPEALIKYNETLGDLLIETGLYSEAIKAYKEALSKLKTSSTEHRKRLNNKLKLAKSLNTYENIKFLPLAADFFLLKAKHIEEKRLKEKLVNKSVYFRLKHASVIYGIAAGVILALIIISSLLKPASTNYGQLPVIATGTPGLKAMSLYDIAMSRGDMYMDKFQKSGYLRVHVLDSAKAAYKRAMYYNMYDSKAVYKYQKAKKILDAYIAEAQEKIKNQPGKYLKIIRPEREGLQFFKFIFNPQNPSIGKYGYIDKNHNIVIPPVFDYHPRQIKPHWVDFHNGKALACVEIDPNTTAYFLINRKGKRISKIIFLPKKNKK